MFLVRPNDLRLLPQRLHLRLFLKKTTVVTTADKTAAKRAYHKTSSNVRGPGQATACSAEQLPVSVWVRDEAVRVGCRRDAAK